jgi:hypothetical protein
MSVKIFLSAVSDEFRDYRDQLRRDLTRHNVEVKVQEDFKDYGSVTLDKLDVYISTCDAVVHLVGQMTGADAKPASTATIIAKYPDIAEKLPPLREPLDKGLGISYTQWEAWLALYHGKALLIANAEEAAPRGPNYNPTDVSRAAQQTHLQRLNEIERYPGSTFASPDNLAKQIAYTTILDLLAKDKHVESPRDLRSFPYAAIFAVLFLLLLTPLAADHLSKTIGLTLAAPISLLGAAGGLALALLYWRYLGILGAGAEPIGSLERQAYDALRASLATGGLPAQLYSRWLTRFLDAVDRFFGDAGMADRTLLPRAFGLRTPAPLWTAPAFDRCILLALLYPIVTIFAIWAASSHVGPAEEALALKFDLPGWRRGFLFAGLGIAAFTGLRSVRATGWKVFFGIAAAVTAAAVGAGVGAGLSGREVAGVVLMVVFFAAAGTAASAAAGAAGGASARAVTVAGTIAVAISVALSPDAFGAAPPFAVTPFAVAFAAAVAAAGTPDGAGGRAIALALVLVVMETSVAGFTAGRTEDFAAITLLFVFFIVVVGAGVVIDGLSNMVIKSRRRSVFQLLFFVAMFLACLAAARFASITSAWMDAGPVALFMGLLTLLNAPFDWASLGLTRALLRRGLELGGWWPYLLALVDALLAGVIIAILALTMVIGVQAFDALAVYGGGKPLLPLMPLFDGLAAHPEASEYWWIYALLLSTMIPSLVNLVIGGTALTRTAPGLPLLLLKKVPAGRAVPAFDRAWVALVLTLQVAGGVILGVAAQALLAAGLIRYVMPWAGLGLLDMARAVAAFDLPARVGALF